MEVMDKYLSRCDIPVEIYQYDPEATDDLYQEFRSKILDNDNVTAIARATGLQIQRIRILRDALQNERRVSSLSQLASVKGIGLKTLEKCFRYIMDSTRQEAVASLL